jgi:hypothetical protein
VPSTSLSRCRAADTTAPTHYTDGASDHPVLKDSSPKPYCLHLQERRMNRCSTVSSCGAEAPVLARLYLDSNWASDRPTMSSLTPSDHLVLLSSLLFLCNSSDATMKGTIGSSGGIKLAPIVAQCTKCSDAMLRWYQVLIFYISNLTCPWYVNLWDDKLT